MTKTRKATIWLEVDIENGRSRLLCLDEAGFVHVATRRGETNTVTSEISYDLGYAYQLSRRCLAGNNRALTTPGLARVLASAVVVLSKAAFSAGALETRSNEDRIPVD